MEPQAESISDINSNMSIKDIYNSLEIQIPEDVKYCSYAGTYEQTIHKAYDDNNISLVRSLIEYRDAMIERENKVKELINN